MSPRHRLCLACVGLAILCAGTSTAGDAPLDASANQRRSLQILAIEHQIAATRNRLVDLISDTPRDAAEPLRSRPELRTLSSELASLSQQLEELRKKISYETSPDQSR